MDKFMGMSPSQAESPPDSKYLCYIHQANRCFKIRYTKVYEHQGMINDAYFMYTF